MTEQTEPTLEQLRDEARELEIEGRSKLNAEELVAAIAEARAAKADNPPPPPPSTPEEVGRPPLADVAAQSYVDRSPIKVVGDPAPEYAQEG